MTEPAASVAREAYWSPLPAKGFGSTCLEPLRTRALAASPAWPSAQAATWGEEASAVAGTAAVADSVVAARASEPATTRPRRGREGRRRGQSAASEIILSCRGDVPSNLTGATDG